MRSTKRVLLADGSRLLREMLHHALEKADRLEVVGEVVASDQEELPSSIARYEPEWVIISAAYNCRVHRWTDPFLDGHPWLRFVFLVPSQNQIKMKWQASHEEEFSNLSLKELIDILEKDLQHT